MNDYDATRLMHVLLDGGYEISIVPGEKKLIHCSILGPRISFDVLPEFEGRAETIPDAFNEALQKLRASLKPSRKLLEDITTWQMLEEERAKAEEAKQKALETITPVTPIDQPACGGY